MINSNSILVMWGNNIVVDLYTYIHVYNMIVELYTHVLSIHIIYTLIIIYIEY